MKLLELSLLGEHKLARQDTRLSMSGAKYFTRGNERIPAGNGPKSLEASFIAVIE